MKGNHKHGHGANGRETPTYRSWLAMVSRCSNPKQPGWKHYGGRGITVCERWREFANFLADMGEAPVGTQIDRTNNDIGYQPDNCRWATRQEQMRNTRASRRITLNGRTQCLAEWAAELGVPAPTIHGRLARGWSVERALGINEPRRVA